MWGIRFCMLFGHFILWLKCSYLNFSNKEYLNNICKKKHACSVSSWVHNSILCSLPQSILKMLVAAFSAGSSNLYTIPIDQRWPCTFNSDQQSQFPPNLNIYMHAQYGQMCMCSQCGVRCQTTLVVAHHPLSSLRTQAIQHAQALFSSDM